MEAQRLEPAADDSTNGDFRLFDPAKRVRVSLEDLDLSFLLRMSAVHTELAGWVPVKAKGPKEKGQEGQVEFPNEMGMKAPCQESG